MVQNLNEYRKTLKGDFEEKVQKMNEITATLTKKNSSIISEIKLTRS
jgi:precorrin-2 dehydrogenase/sirohydrochlorin ferrochelatase